MKMQRRGVEMRLVIEFPGSAATRADPVLIKAVAKAHKWFGEIVSKTGSVTTIAARENIDKGYISHMVNLAFLAPDIIESIISGKQSASLTPHTLMKKIDLPLDWSEQKRLLKIA